MKTKRPFLGLFGAVAVALGVLVSGGASASAATEKTPIKIGYMCTCSGDFGAALSPGNKVVTAWQKSVNSKGGINGHKVEIVSKDDGGNPATAVSNVNSLISEGVAAIIDNTNTGASWSATVKGAGIPVVGALNLSPAFISAEGFFPTGTTAITAFNAIAVTAKQAGAKTLGYMYCAEAANCAGVIGLLRNGAEQQGLTFEFTTEVAQTSPNYTAQCLAAKQAGVEALFISGQTDMIKRIASECNAQDYHPTYLTTAGGFDPTFAKEPGLKDGTWAALSIRGLWDNSNAQVKQMNTAVNKYAPGVSKAPNYAGATFSWVAGKLIERGFAAGGLTASATPTAAMLITGLKTLSNETLGGLSPGVTFNPANLAADKPNGPYPVNCWFTGRILNGKPTLANKGETTCAETT